MSFAKHARTYLLLIVCGLAAVVVVFLFIRNANPPIVDNRDIHVEASAKTIRHNGLVHGPLELTVQNSSQKSFSYFPGECVFRNPTICAVQDDACVPQPQALDSCVHWQETFAPTEEFSSFFAPPVTGTYPPSGEYRAVFSYATEELGRFSYKESAKMLHAYSQPFTIVELPLSVESSRELCEEWDRQNAGSEWCWEVVEKEFSSEQFPISTNQLYKRKEVLLNQEVFLDAVVFLGREDDESSPGPFRVPVLLREEGEFWSSSFPIKENDQFVSCESERKYVPECAGWEQGVTYRVSGTLQYGKLYDASNREEYFIQVDSREKQ